MNILSYHLFPLISTNGGMEMCNSYKRRLFTFNEERLHLHQNLVLNLVNVHSFHSAELVYFFTPLLPTPRNPRGEGTRIY